MAPAPNRTAGGYSGRGSGNTKVGAAMKKKKKVENEDLENLPCSVLRLEAEVKTLMEQLRRFQRIHRFLLNHMIAGSRPSSESFAPLLESALTPSSSTQNQVEPVSLESRILQLEAQVEVLKEQLPVAELASRFILNHMIAGTTPSLEDYEVQVNWNHLGEDSP